MSDGRRDFTGHGKRWDPPLVSNGGEPAQPPHRPPEGPTLLRCMLCDRPAAEDVRILRTGVCTACAGREEINLP